MGQLSADEIQVLNEALDDEYHAWSTYDQVLADFGVVRPFTRIREAEARHIAALLVLFDRYACPYRPTAGLARRNVIRIFRRPVQLRWKQRSPTGRCMIVCCCLLSVPILPGC